MEYIFDELKQFDMMEIKETIIIERQTYYNLIRDKKYIIVHMDKKNPNIIKLIKFAGKFCFISPCSPGPYGDMGEGYYFYGKSGRISPDDENWDTSYCITGEYNHYDWENGFSTIRIFYEIDDNFNENHFINIFKHITKNNELNGIINNIKIKYHDVTICVCAQDVFDVITEYEKNYGNDDNDNEQNK